MAAAIRVREDTVVARNQLYFFLLLSPCPIISARSVKNTVSRKDAAFTWSMFSFLEVSGLRRGGGGMRKKAEKAKAHPTFNGSVPSLAFPSPGNRVRSPVGALRRMRRGGCPDGAPASPPGAGREGERDGGSRTPPLPSFHRPADVTVPTAGGGGVGGRRGAQLPRLHRGQGCGWPRCSAAAGAGMRFPPGGGGTATARPRR